VLISVRGLSSALRAQVPADLVRRMRAKAAFDGQPEPNLSQPESLQRHREALGDWGRRTRAHRVSSSDTLWRLAKAYYGDGDKLRVIQLFNGLAPADVIHDGQVLLIPEPLLSGAVRPEREPEGGTMSGPPL
jgi:nucleoid-associated protein YgaU